MGNHCTGEFSGTVKLASDVRIKAVKAIMRAHGCEEDCYGYDGWLVYLDELGQKYLSYRIEGSGNYSIRYAGDYDSALKSIVSRGYNADAWREKSASSSENGGFSHHSALWGSDEQKRQFRCKEIQEEISTLQQELARLQTDQLLEA